MSKQHDTLLCAISSFEGKYGIAYPSYAKLAQCTGLSELEVAATIKELIEKGRITKKARYDANGRRISNEYRLIEPPMDDQSTIDDKAQNGYPLKSFIKSFKIFKKEDLNNKRERPKMSHDSHMNFFSLMREFQLPHELFLFLFDDPDIRETLKSCKEWHIYDAVDELKYRLSIRHPIYSLCRWFNKVLETCRIKDIRIGGYTA